MSLWKDTMSSKEIKDTASNARNHKAEEVYDVLKRFKEISFEEGDFLLRYDHTWDDNVNEYKWRIERFSEKNDSPRKYKVVYVDEVGIPYIQKVLFNGDMSGDARCLAGYDLDNTVFKLDPDFADHNILMEEEDIFDPLEVYKEKRSEYFKTK